MPGTPSLPCGECKPEFHIPRNCSSQVVINTQLILIFEGKINRRLLQMMFDLFYRILPKDLMSVPFHLNAFLPFWTYSSYRNQVGKFSIKYSYIWFLSNNQFLNYMTTFGRVYPRIKPVKTYLITDCARFAFILIICKYGLLWRKFQVKIS